MEYLVVIERAGKGFSAYIPDVPGCVATGTTPEKVRARLAEALEMHLAGLSGGWTAETVSGGAR